MPESNTSSKKGRTWIHTVARFSNWQSKGISKAIEENGIYADKKAWLKLIERGLLGLGGGFFISGVIFFFAYNWDAMGKFFKLGLAQFGLLAAFAAFWWVKYNVLLKQVFLVMAAAMVGVLFALMGQIYQTGANMYDFFLAWTIFITIWVVLTRYPILWLLYMVLIDTTVILYAQQVARDWRGTLVFAICFILNALVLILWETWQNKTGKVAFPKWFYRTLALAAAMFLTISVIYGIVSRKEQLEGIVFILGIIWAGFAILNSMRQKEVFYIALLPFCGIIIASTFIINIIDGIDVDPIALFFFLGLFVITTTSILIYNIVQLNKKWHGK